MTMEFDWRDLRRLWPNLLALLLCCLAGAAMVLAARHLEEAAAADEARARLAQGEIRSRLGRAGDDAATLREKIARYRQIAARGLIGEEHRLDWAERIRAIRAARRLIDVEYELQPQAAIDPALLSGPADAVDFMSSTMQLHLLLLHEEDLLNVLDDLGSGVDAFVRVRQCKVARLAVAVGMAQLRADCELEWITLRPRQGASS
jgi:hypothetical protein